MRKQFTLILSALVLSIACVSANISDERFSKEQILLSVILSHIDEYHYDNMKYTDEYAEKVYDLYLKNIDQQKRYLLQSDVAILEPYKLELDEFVQDLNFEFYEKAHTTLIERQKELKGYIDEILAEPFDFSVNESIEFDEEKLDFCETKAELKDRWRKILKYNVMIRISDHLNAQEEEKETAEKEKATKKELAEESVNVKGDELVDDLKVEEKKEPKTFEELEVEMREKVAKTYNDWFVRLNQRNDDDYFAQYVNAITQAIDPHSSYYPPEDKENFDINMRGKLEGIGARLTQEGIYTKVNAIIPGSPSSRQGELKAEDTILKVAQGEDEPVDVVDMPLDEVVKLIRGKKGTEVRLTVKKIDGTQTVVPIIRDVVILEDTYAKSAVIENEGTKLGYIDLPSFYSDFSDQRNGRSCYKDIKIELEKFEKEDIEGLVIDLRNNTGGSLQDVVQMVGLFIEQGPIVQVKGKKGPARLHNDYDPSVQYDGPLTVLVNSNSASASEIFAAAIQDYDRGIVIGSESTYGKGTVQRFHNLDRMLNPEFAYVRPLGSVKLTIQKFYRINGGSTQKKGVEPDIVLPDTYAEIEYGERLKDNVMPWSEIKPAKYTSVDDLSDEVVSIKASSTERVKDSELFQLVREQALKLKEQRDNTDRSLHFETFKAENDALKQDDDKFDDLEKKIESITIANLKDDVDEIESDESKKERNEEWLKILNKDFYIYEALNILGELKS